MCRIGGFLAAPDSGFVPPLAGVPLCFPFFLAQRGALHLAPFRRWGKAQCNSAQADRDRRNRIESPPKRRCALLVPLSTTAAPKQHRIRIRPSLASSLFIFILILCVFSVSLSNAHLSRPLLRIALSPKPISIRPRYWLSCCHQPRAAPRHRHLRTFAPAQRPTSLWLQRGLLRASISEKQPALCNICPVQPFEVAEVAPVVCVWRIAGKLRPGACRSAAPLRATVCTPPSCRAPFSA